MSIYAVTFSGHAFTAEEDVFELVAPAGSLLEILDLRLGQYSDFGDAAAEILLVEIWRGYTTAGSGGAAATPANLMSGGAASAATAKINNTTVAADGSPVRLLADAFNVAAGYWYYPPIPGGPTLAPSSNERIKLAKSERLVVRVSAPADELTLAGTLLFRELGGVAG